MISPIIWKRFNLKLIDQLKLPLSEEYVDCTTLEDTFNAIREMIVRGAPAIGITAAYGVVLALNEVQKIPNETEFDTIIKKLAASRPTAVNLFWALDEMKKAFLQYKNLDFENFLEKMAERSEEIHEEDRDICLKIGINGQKAVGKIDKSEINILTHCNAGALATGGQGTVTSVIYEANKSEKKVLVYVDETRPYLQGARLTAFELMKENVDCTLICDNMAGFLMSQGKIDMIVVGADRIAKNGDTANKIGTYSLAVMAKYHNIPFYIAAPYTTFDINLETGSQIPIEERKSEELILLNEKYLSLPNTKVFNPAFDVTPYSLIKGFITEKGYFETNYEIFNIEKIL